MTRLYRRAGRAGFGNAAATDGAAARPARPLKRPSQQRARFTVAAIYEAFVRIWQARGWAGVTTRAVALEAGCSVGTLYEYFPNKEALLSGFVRHAIERLLARIEDEAAHAPAADWRERVGRLVRLCCSAEDGAWTAYDRDMMALEARIAEPKHHQRFFEELCAAWLRVLAACPDLPRQPDAAVVASLAQAVWGARRYRLLLAPVPPASDWALQMERFCVLALEQACGVGAGPPPGSHPGPHPRPQ